MPEYLEHFKSLPHELQRLTKAFPRLDQALNHRLRLLFPRLSRDAALDQLYLNYEEPAQPGQLPVIASRTLGALVEQCYLTRAVPTFFQNTARIYNHPHTLDDQHLTRGITAPEFEQLLDFTTHSLELCVKDALSYFWQTPNNNLDGLTPKAWLTQYTRDLILSEATVRHGENTLAPNPMEAIKQVFPVIGPRSAQPPRSAFSFYEVSLDGHPLQGGIRLHGVFVITHNNVPRASSDAHDNRIVQDETPRTVVLYTPSNGLEAFTSLKALSEEMSARLRDEVQRETILDYVLAAERTRALTHGHVDFGSIEEDDVPTFYNDQLIEKQKHDLQHAWALARTRKQDATLEQLCELIEQSLNSSLPLQPARIVHARYVRLLESRLPQWLVSASDADKAQWRLAVERLNLERHASQAPDTQSLAEVGQKNTLLGYARIQLKQRIKADHGIEIDPDSIFISTTEALQTGPLVYPGSGAGLPSGFAAGVSLERTGHTITHRTTQRSLSELALANVGIWDTTFALTALVKDAKGNRHPVLTPAYLKALVRQLDIGGRYKARLNDLLVNSEQALWRKERYIDFSKAQLQLDLLEARLSGSLSVEHVAWIQHALDHPVEATRPWFNGKQVKVHLLILRYKPLPGALVFSLTGSAQLLCYLPGAPNNRWFVSAHSRNELARRLSHLSLRSYVLQRVTVAQKPYIKPLLEAGMTDTTVQLQIIPHHLLEASYDTEALHAIHEADEQSTSTWESNLNTAKEAALTAIDIISFAMPIKLLLPIVLARFVYQLMQGVDALQRDEEHEALLHFLGAITHLTDGASDFAGSAVFGQVIRQRAKLPAPTLSPAAASPHAATGLKLRTGDEFGTGVLESTSVNNKPDYYVKASNGQLYRSHYDALDQTWRVIDPRKPEAHYQLALRELSAGIWDASPVRSLSNQQAGIERVIESAKVTGIDLRGKNPDARGVYRVHNQRYIEQNGVVFEVSSGWLGRNWYLQVPAGSRSTRVSYKVRRTTGYWEIKHRSGTTKRWEPLVHDSSELALNTAESSYSAYDLPANYKVRVQDLITNYPVLFDNRTLIQHLGLNETSQLFSRLRTRLLTDARAFLKTSPVKPRPILPEIPTNTPPKNLFERLYENTQGIVLGETHAQQSGKQILITQMSDLANNDVKVLFLEHLHTDLHQAHLDAFFESGKMPVALDDFLRRQDAGHRLNPTSPFTYSQLVREAQHYRIRIKALDCTASYNPRIQISANPDLNRYEMFSYFGAQMINRYRSQNPTHKWIALTGNSHANTYQGVPGLAELEGAIGVRVSDAAPGQGHGLQQNLGAVIPPSFEQPDYLFLKNDYWLEIELPGIAPDRPAFSQAQIEAMLAQPGEFMFGNSPLDGPELIQRTRNQEILRSRIQSDNGQFFIELGDWPDIHLKRYDIFDSLVSDLKEKGMQLVNW